MGYDARILRNDLVKFPRNPSFISLHPSVFVVVVALLTLPLAALPGTADVNVWKAWVDSLSREGFTAGYNAGAGHLLHPPLGMLLLSIAHRLPAWFGLPDHAWPDAGWTGFRLVLWVWLTVGALLVLRMTRSPAWAVLFQLAFALNSVVYGAFDLFGIPFVLFALNALAGRRFGTAAFWTIVAALTKFQYLIFLPFVMIYLVREFLVCRRAEAPQAPWRWTAFLPAAILLAVVLALLGPGTLIALRRGLVHDTLSGYALNFGWILTWAMHLRWPESYGPLQDGLITVIRTQDTRILLLVRLMFGSAFVFALWRQWRGPHTTEFLLRYMLAGYLAYFLFNRGVHENHLVPALAVAGYLAWRVPAWRPAAWIIAVAANANLVVFYSLYGVDRGADRLLLGIDGTLPLAFLYVAVMGALYLKLCGLWSPWRHSR